MCAKLLKIMAFTFLISLFLPHGINAGEIRALNDGRSSYVPNKLMVKFCAEATDDEKEALRESLGAEKTKYLKRIGVEVWELPEDISVEDALDLLKDEPIVEYAEPNYLYKPQSIPNDEHFEKQWYLNNSGQVVNGVSGTAGADISALDAWDIETGSSDIIIAVIDTGVAFDHPDLKDNIWENPGEIENGKDDDGNGYIDDIHGWDFVNADNNPSDYSRDLFGDGHGTHVAGIIAAKGDNNTGISGVMWDASIMPLQVFDIFETGSFHEEIIQLENIEEAIEYAVEMGANIINASFGGETRSNVLYDAIEYADKEGVLFITAAGNEDTNNDYTPTYPASYEYEEDRPPLNNIISVAATDETGSLADYSNYGVESVDVAAPGGSEYPGIILSTVPPERVQLFSEDFESGLSNWDTSDYENEAWSIGDNDAFGSHVLMDSTGYYGHDERSSITLIDPIDVSDYKGLSLEFSIYYSLENGWDFLYVEFSKDGIDFPGGYFATGDSGDIVEFQGWEGEEDFDEFYIRFSLETDEYNYNDIDYDGVYIDDVKVTGIKWEFSGDEYDYKSGTSMATPIVAGIAGLIWSYRPDLTHYQVKDAILESVDPIYGMEDKIISGGRVNAYKALARFVTVSTSTSDTTTDTAVDLSPSDEGGGGGCFIATAAYGSYDHPDVILLRKVRDRYLTKFYLGRKFISLYYKYSPPLAEYLSGHDILRSLARVSLFPLVLFSYFLVNFGGSFFAILISLVILMPVLFSLFRFLNMKRQINP